MANAWKKMNSSLSSFSNRPVVRLIPRLDIKGPNVVKGIHLEGLRVVGKPDRFARYYYENGADELLFMDVVASLYGRNSLLEIVERTAREIFIPLTVGGGIRTLDDIRTILRAGADKVSLNTAVVRRPEFIHDASSRFGSSTIIVSIEASKQADGRYEAFTDNGRERTGLNALEWADRAVELGAGELLVTSIDREGTGEGFDLELIRAIADRVSVPVIACGGAGSVDHVVDVFVAGHAQAVCLASLLHYQAIRTFTTSDDFGDAINTSFLRSRQGFSKITDASLQDLKIHLSSRGVSCRPLAVANSHA